jgi:hypothetical protein
MGRLTRPQADARKIQNPARFFALAAIDPSRAGAFPRGTTRIQGGRAKRASCGWIINGK